MKISKTEYAVFVYYKLESKYKKSSKFEEVMVQNQKKKSDLKWNASYATLTFALLPQLICVFLQCCWFNYNV
jgi:hypothetical protein